MNTNQKHPLRWLLLAWLGVVYLQRLLDGSSGPRIPLTDGRIPLPANIDPALFALVAFTLCMVLHCVLHALALFKTMPPYLNLPYFLGQGLLVLAIFSLGFACPGDFFFRRWPASSVWALPRTYP